MPMLWCIKITIPIDRTLIERQGSINMIMMLRILYRTQFILRLLFLFFNSFWLLLIFSFMSDYLKKPILSKEIQYRKGKGFALTSCEMQGWRKSMEDAQIFQELDKDVYLFAVLDGHGGPEVAHYAAKILPKQLLNQPYFKLRNYHRALTNVFMRIDELLNTHRVEQDLKSINKDVKGSYVGKEEKIAHRAGTTAVVLLMTKDKYYVANIGDSRAVLCRSRQAIPLSTDHKPDNPSEHNRIQKAGGFVTEGRVNGTLSLSRSFGDFQYKSSQKHGFDEQCVICVPEITETDRCEEDEFVILGCDGVWERYVANSQKLIDLMGQLLQKHENSKVMMDKLFGQLVARDTKDNFGFDNMTAQLIQFQ